MRAVVIERFGEPSGMVVVAGVVTAVGHDVDRSWLGRRAWAFTGMGGGYAE